MIHQITTTHFDQKKKHLKHNDRRLDTRCRPIFWRLSEFQIGSTWSWNPPNIDSLEGLDIKGATWFLNFNTWIWEVEHKHHWFQSNIEAEHSGTHRRSHGEKTANRTCLHPTHHFEGKSWPVGSVKISSSWWFQPIWKILVKMGIFPK